MKKIKYHKPIMTERKIAPRFLLRRKSGFGQFGQNDVLMAAVWAVSME